MTRKMSAAKAVNNAERQVSSPCMAVVQETLNSMIRVANDLGFNLSHGGDHGGAFEEIRCILEALPLSIGEFAVAKNHLKNAIDYLQEQEQGAALFELRMLMAQVAHLHGNADSNGHFPYYGK